MSHQEAMDYLDSFLNYEQAVAYRYPEAFSLDRIARLLERLGNPHRRYAALHVAGTKGKGSTCAFAASILQAAGCRIGLYTSPHLVSFRERIRLNGRPIPEEDLARVVEKTRPVADRDLTYFEITTACAFLYFAEEQADAAVVEVGLGGRLDATNVLAPAVAAITPVGLDHMSKLGNTVGQIAREKAGIIKPGVPLVMGPQEPAVSQVIRETASARGAPLHAVEREVKAEAVEPGRCGTRCAFQTPAGFYPGLSIPLLGRHQVGNAAAAVRMAELFFERRGAALSPENVRDGLARVHWPGRCQWVPGAPPVLLDGAQSADSARALRRTVEELFPGRRITLVLGISLDKDMEGIASVLGPWAGRVIVTRAGVPRAESPSVIARALRPWHRDPLWSGSVAEALDQARQETPPEGLVVAAGSLFVVAEALLYFKIVPWGVCASSETALRR